MSAATLPRPDRGDLRLLVLDAADGTVVDRRARDLPTLLSSGDVLVVNDAATLPASLFAVTARGERFELRLASNDGDGFVAVALGEGGWHVPTEERGPAPRLAAGGRLRLEVAAGAVPIEAEVLRVDAVTAGPSLVTLRFVGSPEVIWPALYGSGRPIQYSYLSDPLALWHVQNVFAARPWAFEMPSAGQALTWESLLGLRERGVELASVTHAAGVSSTGSPELDRRLPLAERFEVPVETVRTIARARGAGRRVVAVGTTTVRALESAAAGGQLRHGPGEARLVLDAAYELRVVDTVLSGIHTPGSSHYRLLGAFAPSELLARAASHAVSTGYREHEFGDVCLVFGSRKAAPRLSA